MIRELRRALELFCGCLAIGALVNAYEAQALGSKHRFTRVPHEVLAFYYPWYGRDGRHWRKIDAARHEISDSTHYPLAGAYDSHDSALIGSQIEMASKCGITGFIASWWGQGTFEDQAIPLLLKQAQKLGFKISVYWEDAKGKDAKRVDRAISDLVYLVTQYGKNPSFLKVDGKPVIFVYGRVVGEIPKQAWLAIVQGTRAKAGDFLLIAEGYSEDHARTFDGMHAYNYATAVERMRPEEIQRWATKNFSGDVNLARKFQCIACATVIPGYDDTKIRKPGDRVERSNGKVYRALWEGALNARPDWVLITSWNEWHEGSEIEPSLEYGNAYMRLTAEQTARFR
jgi:glycoprotein endo-alpha-1,2-mannosidase